MFLQYSVLYESVRGSTFKVFVPVRRIFYPTFSLVKKQQNPARSRCFKTHGFRACVEENISIFFEKCKFLCGEFGLILIQDLEKYYKSKIF